MTKSREELVLAALAIVGGDGGTGQAPEAEDVEFVGECVDSTLANLASRSIYPYSNADEIEEDAFEQLAVCLAYTHRVLKRYGAADDPVAVAEAHRILRTITAATLSYQPAHGQYF